MGEHISSRRLAITETFNHPLLLVWKTFSCTNENNRAHLAGNMESDSRHCTGSETKEPVNLSSAQVFDIVNEAAAEVHPCEFTVGLEYICENWRRINFKLDRQRDDFIFSVEHPWAVIVGSVISNTLIVLMRKCYTVLMIYVLLPKYLYPVPIK